jgi:uncharacterized membrane protein
MNPAIPFLVALPTLLPAVIFLTPLFWQRKTQMFTIAVQPEFLRSADAARLRRIYFAGVTALGVGGFTCSFVAIARSLASPLQWLIIAAPLIEVAGLLLIWAWAWHRTLPHRLPHAVVRTASLNEKPIGAEWWLSAFAAWIPLAIAGCILQQRWLQIPASFPTHWGLDGQPNGWTTRSVEGVYWPLALAAGLVLMMAVMGWVLARYSAGSSTPLKRMTLNLLRAVCWMLALLFSGTALLPLMHHPERTMLWMVAAMMATVLAMVAYAIATVVRDHNFAQLQNTTAESAWKWGIIYYNPQDAALFVPKRLGFGFTVNFGRPVVWLAIAGFIALAILPIFLAHGWHAH